MGGYRISCLLFTCFLTSITQGEKVSYFNNTKISKDVFLIFKQSDELPNVPNDEDIVEETKELQPNVVYYLNVQFIPDWAQFIILQTHAYLHNVTLGYNIEKLPKKYVTGQNIGLVQNVTTSRTAQFFLENDNPFNVSVLVAVVAYSKNAPVPGGCNLEFEVETAPWLRVNVTGPMVSVSSQPSRGPSTWGVMGPCDLPSLRYQSYHLYLPEKDFQVDTYFDYLRRMITVKRILQNGRLVPDTAMGSMLHTYSAYHGTGSVYATVVTINSLSSQQDAAYVPALTYTCSPDQYTDTCQVLTSTFSRSLLALVLFIGLFVCFFGHSFFQTELFLMSTLMGSILTYILVAPLGMSDSANVVLATVGGITIANFWLLLWWTIGSPLFSLIVATLSLGFLSASLVFYTPLADNVYMESNVNFWLAFLCCMLVVAVMFAPYTNRVNILACSVVGSYAAIVPVDHYIGASLKYIFINTMRRATVSGFNQAIIDPPFQIKDGVLALIWVGLAVVGFLMQSQRFGDKPVFPRSPHHWGSMPTTPRRNSLVSEERPLLYGSPGSDSVFT
uniref:TM7S3/TM198-like domain-containing protein n=1 Tax=Graphocephala atropunctata TaxID=36148 RepID=A0A1B6KBX2_9HEMI